MRKFLLAFWVLIACGSACVSLQEKIESDPLRSLANWPQSSEALEDRVRLASPEMVRYIGKVNEAWGDPVRATAVPPNETATREVLQDFRRAVESLPQEFKMRLANGVVGFFLIRNLGSTAMTFSVRDEKDQPRKAFILLDIDAVNKPANDWATWKEATAFEGGPFSFRLTIENANENTRSNTIQYILLHEVGHVLAMLRGVMPEPGREFRAGKRPLYPYMNFDWFYGEDSFQKKYDKNLPKLRGLKYYSVDGRKPNAEMIPVMEELQKSDFFTLYGTLNPHDDFAEAFALYIHALVLQKPFKVEVYKGPEKVKTYAPCFEETRCKPKLRFLDDFVRTMD